MEAGGGQTKPSGGGVEEVKTVPETIEFDPDDWVLSVFRSLKGYVLAHLDLDLYDVEFGFPSSENLGEWLPFTKTIIHFEIDDISHPPIGFGDNIVDVQYDETDFTLIESEAQAHLINWDIGVWASAETGGVTARLQAFQVLSDLFNGPSALTNLREIGIELRSFAGGAFVKEEIDNVSVFRVVNITLVTRVFSRKRIGPTPFITDIDVVPEVSVDGDGQDVIVTDE